MEPALYQVGDAFEKNLFGKDQEPIYVSTQFPRDMLVGGYSENRGSKKNPKVRANPKPKGRPKVTMEKHASFFETMWKREGNKRRVENSRKKLRAAREDMTSIWVHTIYHMRLNNLFWA